MECAGEAKPPGDSEAAARTSYEKTDLDLKAGANRLLLGSNYSTGIDVEVLGISEPGVPESGLARLAEVLPGGLHSLVR